MGKIKWVETLEQGQTVIKEWHKVYVHKFNMGDVEDPELYAGPAISNWQKTDQGKFIMDHGRDHSFQMTPDYNTYGYMCVIQCELEAKKLTEYYLKWGKFI